MFMPYSGCFILGFVSLDSDRGLVVQSGSNARFASERSRVQIPPSPLIMWVQILECLVFFVETSTVNPLILNRNYEEEEEEEQVGLKAFHNLHLHFLLYCTSPHDRTV